MQVGTDVNGVTHSKTVYGKVERLPVPQQDTTYIVSGILAQRVNRPDVTYPNQLVRDELERVVSCLSIRDN